MTSTYSTPVRRGVVGVLIRGDRLLLIRRSEHVVAPFAWCFPGGGIDGDETEPVALIRELREELGIDVHPRRLLWRSTTPWNVELAWWLAEIGPEVEPVPNPLEVHSFAWCSVEEMLLLDQLLESNRHFLAAWDRGEVDLPRFSVEDGTAG